MEPTCVAAREPCGLPLALESNCPVYVCLVYVCLVVAVLPVHPPACLTFYTLPGDVCTLGLSLSSYTLPGDIASNLRRAPSVRQAPSAGRASLTRCAWPALPDCTALL